MPSYKFTYFNFEAKGEPIRLMLSYMGVNYVDYRIEMADWPKNKSEVKPFGKLPLLEVDGKLAHQSLAITRYLGREADLAGKNNWESLQIDMTVETIEDVVQAGIAYYKETNEEVKARKKHQLFNEMAPLYLSQLNNQIKENKGYLVNGRLSWADVYLFGESTMLSTLLEMNIFEKYPNFKVLKDNVLAVPNIKAWVDKRPVAAY